MTLRNAPRRSSPLARRLIIYTIAFSSLVTLMLTSLQLYGNYRVDVKSINENLAQFRDVHLESISESLWAAGRARLKVQLDGMLRVRDMHYLAVRDGDTLWAEAGELKDKDVIRVDLPIMHDHRDGKVQIGVLTAVATLDGVYQRIIDDALVILASNALKTFLVAGFMIFLIRGLVTRHLEHIAGYMRSLEVHGDPPALQLDRPTRTGDELDVTVDAIRSLQVAVREALDRYRTSEAHYRSLFENANDAIFLVDPKDGSLLDCNRRAEATYGYTRSELLRMTVHDLGPAEDRAKADARLRLVESRGGMVFERKHRMRNGELRPVEISSRVVDVPGERVILSIVRDLSERERALQALRESEERYRSVVTSMAEGIVITASDGTILACNPAAERIAGVVPGQLVGATANDPRWKLIREDGTPLPLEDIPAALTLRTGLPVRDAIVGFTRPDLTVAWVSVNAQAIGGENDAAGNAVVMSFTDITARKEAEVERARLQTQLQQAQKMEAIGQMAGGIAHDFNNILGSIIGYASLALERYTDERDGKLADCLREVLSSGERARDLVAKLMAFSRARPVSPRTVEPGIVVQEVVAMMASTIPSSISLKADIERDMARARIDPVHLQQIVMNLCVNARDAIATRGNIEISVRHAWGVRAICASCHAELTGDYIEISVRDDGAGIAADQLARVFEPFFTTKGPGKGSGLGLAVVHGIVHDYSGHLVLSSEPGVGTTIRVFLPAVYETEIAEEPAEKAVLPLPGVAAGKHVLVIDDEEVLARLIAEVLRAHGYRVTSFSDSRMALDTFMRYPNKFDAIITDQTMPGLTGRELANQVLKVRPDLPVILCTGYSDQIDEISARDMGISRFMMKPVKPQELMLLLDDILVTHH
jgi:PAS domain S-box-containing protein